RFGPDLALAGKEATDVYLVESVLYPSRVIKKGFETTVLTLSSGKTLMGLLVAVRADALVLRDSAQDYQPVTIPKVDIETRTTAATSLMPEGLAAALTSRQEFLDLCRFL